MACGRHGRACAGPEGRSSDAAATLAALEPWIQSALSFLLLWLAWRRFQDHNRPGWLALLPTAYLWAVWLVPLPLATGSKSLALVGLGLMIAFAVGLCLPPTVGPNLYGPDPRGWRSPEHYPEERRQGRAT